LSGQAASALSSASLLGALSGIFVLVVIFGALALFFIVAIGNRTDSDPTGSRPMAAYLFSGSFIFLWITFLGLDVAANSLIQLLGSHSVTFGSITVPGPSYTNAAIRACVLGGLLLVFAGGAFVVHLSRGTDLADGEADPSGPTKRIMRSYVALVSFVSIVIVVISLVAAAWLVCGLISPTIFLASSSKTVTLRSLLDALVLVLLAGVIFVGHQRLATDSVRLFSPRGGTPTGAADDGRGAHAASGGPAAG